MEMLFLFSKHFPMHSPMSVSPCFYEVGGNPTTSKRTLRWERGSGGRPLEKPRSGERGTGRFCGQALSQPLPPQVRVPLAVGGRCSGLWTPCQSLWRHRRGSQVLCWNHFCRMKESSRADPPTGPGLPLHLLFTGQHSGLGGYKRLRGRQGPGSPGAAGCRVSRLSAPPPFPAPG